MAWLFQGDEAELQGLSDPDFVAVWSALFGEPPAALIDRREMIALMRSALQPPAKANPTGRSNRLPSGPAASLRAAP